MYHWKRTLEQASINWETKQTEIVKLIKTKIPNIKSYKWWQCYKNLLNTSANHLPQFNDIFIYICAVTFSNLNNWKSSENWNISVAILPPFLRLFAQKEREECRRKMDKIDSPKMVKEGEKGGAVRSGNGKQYFGAKFWRKNCRSQDVNERNSLHTKTSNKSKQCFSTQHISYINVQK